MADQENKTVEPEEGVEDVDDSNEDEAEGEVGDIANQVMKNPQILAALQERLGTIVGSPSTYIASLPKPVKRRIKALKKLQFDVLKIESDFYKEVHELECKFASKYSSLFEKRKEIVNGSVEPTDDECDWPSDDEKDEDELAEDLKNKAAVEDDKEKKEEDMKGIPYFWSTVFRNVEMLNEMIQEHDEPILKHLKDVKVVFADTEQAGFTLEFHFEPNEFFTDTVLTKQYTMRFQPDSTDPFSFEGPEIIKCKGCPINWNKGKNVTVKVIKKKQKHKGRGTTRTVTKTVQNDSFFNFFSPPSVPEGEEAEMDDDLEALLAADFEIGHFIRERIVPRAVLYFTGEAIENDEYDDEENEEEHDEEGEYDEENDADFQPQGGAEKPVDCKQQ